MKHRETIRGIFRFGLTVTADFTIDGAAQGENLAPRFKRASEGVFKLELARPIRSLPHGLLKVSVKDHQG